MNARRTLLCGSALAAAALALSVGAPPASAQDRDALILLGKNVFFDKQLSTPRGKQSCASCHDPRVGWTLPLSNINATTVGAPGAQPGALGGRKPQNNSYVQGFLGEYTPGALGPATTGGAFWDGRAEGCGASTNDPECQVGTGRVSETITANDLPAGSPHVEFLGPVADQALNPTARPGVEQNTREKSDCQIVKTAKYKDLYQAAWGEPIDCNQQGDPPAFHISFKRLAVAVAAWQGSPDVNSFTSPRDDCIRRPQQFDTDATPGRFPCANLTAPENLGHDLFFGTNDSGLNRIVPNPAPGGPPEIPLNAGCSGCHNNFVGNPNAGNQPNQTYTDTAYHSIALPFNREISRDDEDAGLFGHDDLPGDLFGLGEKGLFKTPTLRNVTKNQLGITKAFMHNGYFKDIKDVVHYYNTRFDGTGAPTDFDPANNSKTVCDDPPVSIVDATAEEAIDAHCWPVPEVPSTVATVPFAILPGLLGNLGLTSDEEAALVAFIQTLNDARTPTAPPTVK